MSLEPAQSASAKIALLTGPVGSGKSTVAGRVAELAWSRQGLSVAGLWCPARLEDGIKTGIEAVDLDRGERRLLAVRTDLPGRAEAGAGRAGPRTGRYRFDPEVAAWGSRVLAAAVAARPGLLVVDGIGPLELERGEGWEPVLAHLAGGAVPCALIVVRDRLLKALEARLGDARTLPFPITPENRESLPGEILSRLLPGMGPRQAPEPSEEGPPAPALRVP